MENKEKKRPVMGYVIAALAALNWFMLIALKVMGGVDLSWPVVLLGCLWIPAITLVLATVVAYIIVLAADVKHKIRERRQVRRIREQAKALNIWDKPQALGGRALDMSAWENFGIKRKRGETDMHLRRRCMAKADPEYINKIWRGHVENE